MKHDRLPPGPGGSNDLLIGAGAAFEGKLTFKGTVRIDSPFKGRIVTDDVLIVGEHARIEAEISCGTVIVDGEVIGSIKARSGVELRRRGKVRGDIETPSLVVEKGALLHAEVKREQLTRLAAASAGADGVAEDVSIDWST